MSVKKGHVQTGEEDCVSQHISEHPDNTSTHPVCQCKLLLGVHVYSEIIVKPACKLRCTLWGLDLHV